MNRSLRILVADDDRDTREFLERFLPSLGHEAFAVAETGRQLVEQCRTLHPDLIITDIMMPEMDGIEAAAQIYKDNPMPIILLSAHSDRSFIDRAEVNHVMAYLIKPIKETDLDPAIVIAMKRFEEFQLLQKEAEGLRQALENRKVIERAKGIIMKRSRVEEQEAFRRLQKLASDRGLKLIDIARMFLVAEEGFQPVAMKTRSEGSSLHLSPRGSSE